MSQSKPRENRTITVDFQDAATYHRLRQDSTAYVQHVATFLQDHDLELKHKPDCLGGYALTRHSHYARVRLDGLVIWRVACKHCRAVFTVLPQFVLRYSALAPAAVKPAVYATHGGLSLELCDSLFATPPMALYRVVCAFGRTSLVSLLTRCGLTLPPYLLADEKHSHCRQAKVYLPTIVTGRVIWHLGYTHDKSAASFQASYQQFRATAQSVDPDYAPDGILTDGFESTRKSWRHLFPDSALGNCLRHATARVRSKLHDITTPLRDTLSQEFHALLYTERDAQPNAIRCLGQQLRRFAEKVTRLAGADNGTRIHEWITRKKCGWYALLRHPEMPTTATYVDQAHNALDRKLFMMKAFHHPTGHQAEFLTSLAALYNLVPYQRRAKNAGKCGVEVEGGHVPSNDWFLNLQILTAGGLR